MSFSLHSHSRKQVARQVAIIQPDYSGKPYVFDLTDVSGSNGLLGAVTEVRDSR